MSKTNFEDYEIVDVPQPDGTTIKMLVPKEKPGMFKRLGNWWKQRTLAEKIGILSLGFFGCQVGMNVIGMASSAVTPKLESGGGSDPTIDTTYLDSDSTVI